MDVLHKFGTEELDLDQAEHVIVPKSELVKLEQARLTLYRLLEDQTKDIGFLTRLVDITQTLWNIANRRWPEVKQ